MAYSYTLSPGNGSTTQYAVAFGYIRREHVLATVAGSPVTFTWVNNSLIQMDTAPANGAEVRVYRVTPLSAPLVDFTDGATLVAADLDTNAKQSIYTQQELDDSFTEDLADVIPNGDKGDITTSVGGTVWTIDAGAVVEAKIATGAVTAAKIAAGAFTNSVGSTSTTTIATPNSVKTAYDLATTANATANAALPKAGGTMTGVINFATNQPRLISGTAVASTSGTSIEFTEIPSWVKRVTVMFDGVSTNGTSPLLLQTGSSGGVETSGYAGMSGLMHSSGANTYTGVTAGFPLTYSYTTAASLGYGLLAICKVTGNTWALTGSIYLSSQAFLMQFAGTKTLSDTLDRVRITTVSGTDTFDAGSINILYEG